MKNLRWIAYLLALNISVLAGINPNTNINFFLENKNIISNIKELILPTEKKDGCYIWKDSSGKWNISWIGKEKFLIFGEIQSESNLKLDTWCGSHTDIEEIQEKVICFRGSTEDSQAGFSFDCYGFYFDFNLMIEGNRYPSKVFIGDSNVSPSTLPLRIIDSTKIQNRPNAIKGFKGIVQSNKKNKKSSGDEEEIPPKKFNDKKRSQSPALQLPDHLKKGWQPAQAPIPKCEYFISTFDRSKSEITEAYDVATGKIYRIIERNLKKNKSKKE